MGQFINGQWVNAASAVADIKSDGDGRFVRKPTTFRQRISADGSTPFPAAAGRYHLYVSFACPWAHRTLITRKLKGLEDVISVSVVHHHMTDEGWHFAEEDGATRDHLYGSSYLRELYSKADPNYTGRVTVPILWDKETNTIVNNESRDIIQMFDREFDDLGASSLRLFPEDLMGDINATIDANYNTVNNGVYRSGFARSQQAYEEGVNELFNQLDECDRRLGTQRYLCGNRLTAADICLFPTLVRFDAVYYVHFKCNRKHIYEYDNLGPYRRDIYQQAGVKETVNMQHIKQHYFASHLSINPYGIVPVGGGSDLDAPHNRDRFG